MTSRAQVFVPATVGNVGPGFDVLGLAVEGLGDVIDIELVAGPSSVAEVKGRDADAIPRAPSANCAVIAALSLLRRIGDRRGVVLRLERALPVSGGLGSSAAASVGGAYAAALASGLQVGDDLILAAALDGETHVAGRHLDNIAPAYFGGLTIILGTDPPDVLKAEIKGSWWLTLVSPATRLPTKKARSVLPDPIDRKIFTAQLGFTAGLVTAFATGDSAAMRRSLHDAYAEPLRAPLIQGFSTVKAAALAAGALGCSISGAGPTLFAISTCDADAQAAALAMCKAFTPIAAVSHVGRLATRGARRV